MLERHVLVHERADRRPAHPLEVLGEGGVVAQVCPLHDRVGEHADQGFQLAGVAPGHGRADREVVLTAEAAEHHLEGRQQRHVGGAPVACREGRRSRQHVGGHNERQHGSDARGDLGTRARGQVERWHVGQLLAPVVERAATGLAGHRRALLDGERRVRRRERLERLARARLHDLARDDVDRPAVSGDVVHGQDEHRVVSTQPDEQGAQQRRRRQVEPPVGLLGRQLGRCRLVPVHDAQLDVRVLDEHRLGTPVGRLDEAGAQRLVGGDAGVEGRLEHRVLQPAAHPMD